ncbi:uncharacterized protein FOMMEDRAFT_153538 [Fomitiporia mediterranea MF3/22]|uniref:uncharacterized protein n=1 Tax=Fomitiporia mediterranea (strain MF3/22) TaxID=694068 RepID=UPI0004407F19|nr:uncharacterized protein FOMMEDRAFT_153538 [Fomitiporia mediterranea MF3/22]EJD06149.1 hypothetical protein FOMMEDRAFT_153538 [Fomitiporia mediterranea MF3/22]
MQSVSTRLRVSVDHADFFTDSEGQPVKFRIQPGFSSVLRTRLEDGITSHGGIVINKIPIRGIVIVDPKSRSGQEIVCEWAWAERPSRYFVSYAFVLQCFSAKKLLVLDEHALRPEDFVHTLRHIGETQLELSTDVEDQLALYLATFAPDHASGMRSSNGIYQRLVKNKRRYPWVGDYSWKVFRDHYCKNKRFYDKFVSTIIKERGQTITKTATIPRKEFLIVKKPTDPIVEAVIPVRKNVAKENTGSTTDKKIQPGNALRIERKRKFGNNVANVERKTKTHKILRTIDDMLNAPLPEIIAERKSKSLSRSAVRGLSSFFPAGLGITTCLLDSGVLDVEIGRVPPGRPKPDVWIDDKFRDNDLAITSEDDAEQNVKSQSLNRFRESFSYYGMDLDDLRSSAILDAMKNNIDEDLEDEKTVANLLGRSIALSEALPPSQETGPLSKGKATAIKVHSHGTPSSSTRPGVQDQEDPKSVAIRELAANTHFTREEVEEKLTGFSGDVDKACEFFKHCRQLIEDLLVATGPLQFLVIPSFTTTTTTAKISPVNSSLQVGTRLNTSSVVFEPPQGPRVFAVVFRKFYQSWASSDVLFTSSGIHFIYLSPA